MMDEPNFIRLSDVMSDSHDGLEELLLKIKNNLSLSDEEIDVIRKVNLTLKEPTPSVDLQIQSRISRLDRHMHDVNNLIFSVKVKKNDLEYKYKCIYDPKFAMLVKSDRPSTQAIDSEIHAKDRALQDMRQELNNFDALIGLLFGYLKTIADHKETCMKLWGTY